MSPDFDCIVVGSGPAGVSVSFPLLEAGRKVLMVDGGKTDDATLPDQPFLTARTTDEHQWQWFAGDASPADESAPGSPKLRVPTQQFVFDGFCLANRIETRNFSATGSLATGGLSNAWGCGVASLSASELQAFPASAQEMRASYASVARRMGISGRCDDDLREYFGLDEWATEAIALDVNNQQLLARYSGKKADFSELGFRLGRSRVAVLSQDTADQRMDGRAICDLSANCLWGCHRGATWSATHDLAKLKRFSNFHYEPGVIVSELSNDGGLNRIHGFQDGQSRVASARQVFLAAGTLASTAIVLRTMGRTRPCRLMHCPSAAFLLWLPRRLGSPRVQAFGLGQLSFALKLNDTESAFGSTFNTTGLPIAEFLRSVPFGRRTGIDLLRGLLSSCVVANVFLPGGYSASSMGLAECGSVMINGGFREDLPAALDLTRTRLRRAFTRLGAFMVPGSFTPSGPGTDIHYAATLPMVAHPGPEETSDLGELAGLPGVHVVDGACLPGLGEKSHTLTIMANADRIGRALTTKT